MYPLQKILQDSRSAPGAFANPEGKKAFRSLVLQVSGAFLDPNCALYIWFSCSEIQCTQSVSGLEGDCTLNKRSIGCFQDGGIRGTQVAPPIGSGVL